MKTILEVVRDLIKPYIDTNASNIATVEDSTVENPYYVGDQLIYKGVLYNVTADISIGDTLEIGTNISIAPKLSNSIKSALNKLKSDGTSSGTDFNFDIQNGVPGWNSASNRDSSTFHPFSAGSTASDISYDNTTSGLTSTDVQAAIDEVDSNTDKKLPTYANGTGSWDTTPTQNSTKPVTSGGVKAQFDAVTNEFTDVNTITGAKNLGLANIAGNYVSFGITWNMLSDGSITASGTPAQESGSGIYSIGKFTLPAGTYTITSGITNTELNERAYTFIRTTSDYVVLATSNNSQSVTNTFTLSTATEVEFGCHIYGSTAINVRIFPMCRVASITDESYVPFAMTNRQLYEASVGDVLYSGNFGSGSVTLSRSAADYDNILIYYGYSNALNVKVTHNNASVDLTFIGTDTSSYPTDYGMVFSRIQCVINGKTLTLRQPFRMYHYKSFGNNYAFACDEQGEIAVCKVVGVRKKF